MSLSHLYALASAVSIFSPSMLYSLSGTDQSPPDLRQAVIVQYSGAMPVYTHMLDSSLVNSYNMYPWL